MLLAFKSTISSNPIAKISIGGDSSSGTLVTSTSAGNKKKTLHSVPCSKANSHKSISVLYKSHVMLVSAQPFGSNTGQLGNCTQSIVGLGQMS
jgi:hypothetical protein